MAERCSLAMVALCATIYLLNATLGLGAEDAFEKAFTLAREGGPLVSIPPCMPEENVSIHGGTLSFTDSALRNIVIGFEPRQDGSFDRIYNDIGGGTVPVECRIVGDVLEADVVNGACEYHWRLKKG
jgi:hypothetical protein